MRNSLMAVAALVLLVASTGLTGCGTAQVKADPAELEGSWVLESVGGEDVAPGVTSEITFADGEVTGNGGVNSFGGSYKAEGANQLEFGDIVSTKMAGSDEANAQEAAFFDALDKTERFDFEQDKLVLSDAGNNTLAILTPR